MKRTVNFDRYRSRSRNRRRWPCQHLRQRLGLGRTVE